MTDARPEASLKQEALLAAHELERNGKTLTTESILVAAWKRHPERFGLKGYEKDHPDSHKIRCVLYGPKGLLREGLLKLAVSGYTVTEFGKQRCQTAVEAEQAEKMKQMISYQRRLRNGKFGHIVAASDSCAMHMYESGQKSDISFAESLRFWGILVRNTEGALVDKKEEFNTLDASMEKLIDEFKSNGAEVAPSGREITYKDVLIVRNLHQYLKGRYEARLKLVLNEKK